MSKKENQGTQTYEDLVENQIEQAERANEKGDTKTAHDLSEKIMDEMVNHSPDEVVKQ